MNYPIVKLILLHKVKEGIRLYNNLSNSFTVGQLFRRKVHTLKSTDSLSTGLELIRKQRFNQIPIYRNSEFIGLVTADGITNWLADKYPEGVISGEMPNLIDIYHHEKRNRYRFVSECLSVYEAEEYFKKTKGQGKRIAALHITQNGNRSEKLHGIVTTANRVKID